MTDGIAAGGPRGPDIGRTLERVAASADLAMRDRARPKGQGQGGELPADALPVVEKTASRAVDPVALGEARDRIAAMLADADAGGPDLTAALDGLVPSVPMPLAPGASEDAVAAAQAVAQLIASNARPALGAQARLGRAAVKSVIGE